MKIQIVKCSNSSLWYYREDFPIKTNVIEAVNYRHSSTYIDILEENESFHNYYYSIDLNGMINKSDCINDEENYTIEECNDKPTKQSDGKLFYELDWEFVEGMAKRMELNKSNGKYDRFGWRDKGVDITEMNQALIRHLIAILKGELQDDEQLYSHYYALACNSMLIINQLKSDNEFS